MISSQVPLVAECELLGETNRWLVSERYFIYYFSCTFSNQVGHGPVLHGSKRSGCYGALQYATGYLHHS